MHKKIGTGFIKRCVCLVFLVVMMCGCANKSNSQNKVQDTAKPMAVQSFTGVITSVDKELKQLSVREIDTDVDTIINYDDTAEIKDKYKQDIYGDELEQGMIMKTTYRTSDAKLVSMEVPEDAWEYKNVDKFSFDTSESSMEVADELYQYSEQTYFGTSGNKAIEMVELSEADELTVRGIGYKVYSVIRTEGHGYLRLLNYKDFIGGMINIDDDIILPVTNNMLITVSCGNYRVTLNKGTAKASKTVSIKNNKESTLDFSDYRKSIKNVGSIKFNIDPIGADLYINGTKIDYSKPISLNYGTYSVSASLNGYSTYNGKLTVAEASKTINISLETSDTASAATGAPQSTESSETTEPQATAAATSKSKTKTKKIDSNHTISVTAPEGAEVYLDNVYKGIVPCKFTKVIGSQTITLSKSGYVTKSYSVDILDDDKNVKLSFSELIEDADK